MELDQWKNYIIKSCDSYQKAADCKLNGNEGGEKMFKKEERTFDKLAESELRDQLTKTYIEAGRKIGMSKDDVFTYIRLGSQMTELSNRIVLGKWHIKMNKKQNMVKRMAVRLDNLEFMLETVREEMNLMVTLGEGE